MDNLNISWMSLRRSTIEYINGVNDFLDKAFECASKGNEILCPCKDWKNRYWHYRNVVEGHLFEKSFVDGYKKWIFHGERSCLRNTPHQRNNESPIMHDDIDGLLHDTFRYIDGDVVHEEGAREGLSEDAKRFFKLVEEIKKELYPGCEKFTKLSFIIRLYLLKCLHGLSNVAFSDLLDLLKEAFPFAELPESFNKAKKVIKNLGLGYEKIHACPNDCMLFWKNNSKEHNCSVCGSSRWSNVGNGSTNTRSKTPAKVLRYFPLKPRLQRIFMCSETAVAMRWHATERPNDGNIRHPADGEAWKDFDSLHPTFSKYPRNVRLGLSSEGFNPFITMSISHSTWPVILMNYNLSPWICMKSKYIMLSMIIPGPSSPGNDIDVYLQPLIDELKELWEFGVETYDGHTNQTFQMRAALLWTISDFPALAMLSGWSTKERLACPTCNYNTCSQYLKHSRKMCYLGHRAFLPPEHPYRRDKKSFNGEEDHRLAPTPLSGTEAFEKLRDFNNVFGKGRKKRRRNTEGPWKKRSIFFELPYWETNKLRHNLDVMHIEKNIYDSLLGTLLDISGKSKDHINSCYDLQDIRIRKELQPIKDNTNGKIYLAKSCFFMKPKEKKLFCTVLKNVKLPKGCASNISKRVDVEEMKISGYKSHDAHFIMHYLLQVTARKTLPKNVALALIRLGNFFKAICAKVIKRGDLDALQAEIKEIICDLEKKFPPFFDIMVHLPIHLVEEIKLGGPNHLLWMYSTEREMCNFKGLIHNRYHLEASIAEGCDAEDCLTISSRYLHDGVKTRFSRYQTEENEDIENEADNQSPIFPKIGHLIGGRSKNKGKTFSMGIQLSSEAHRYVLFNTEDEHVEDFIKEHKALIDSDTRSNAWTRARNHSQEFGNWFKQRVKNAEVPNHLKWLAKGPNRVATKRYTAYFINGNRFHTLKRDSSRKSQNSEVTLFAATDSFASAKDQNPIDGEVIYYGTIQDIIEIDYYSCFSVVLFRCDWFHNEIDEYGLTRVYFTKFYSTNDPFVLASQVHQVFYVEDPIEKDVYYARNKVPTDLFDLEEEDCSNIGDTFWRKPTEQIGPSNRIPDADIRWSRDDIPIDVIDMPPDEQFFEETTMETSEEEDDFDDTDWDWMEADD